MVQPPLRRAFVGYLVLFSMIPGDGMKRCVIGILECYQVA